MPDVENSDGSSSENPDTTDTPDYEDSNDGSSLNDLSIRVMGVDVEGVKGFVIVKNIDEMAENELIHSNSLYSICSDGQLVSSVFILDVVSSHERSDGLAEEIEMGISTSFQVVPSIINDLGNYLLFSGCCCSVDRSEVSEDAYAVCMNQMYSSNYLMRKSDGVLFDLKDQFLSDFTSDERDMPNLAPYMYKPNIIYVRDVAADGTRIVKIEDKGEVIKVTPVTQYSKVPNGTYYHPRYAVDNEENVFLYYPAGNYTNHNITYVEVYYSAGGFNTINQPDFSKISSTGHIMDICTDDVGEPYVFMHETVLNNQSEPTGMWVSCCSLKNGQMTPVSEEILIPGPDWFSPVYYQYLGFYNNSFKWHLRHITAKSLESWIQYGPGLSQILSFDITTREWSLEPMSEEIEQALTARYDAMTDDAKVYGVKVGRNTIDVTEIDLLSQSLRSYFFTIDTSEVILQSHYIIKKYDIPYLIINGKRTSDGAETTFMVNLINGENTSSFVSDFHSVVSFINFN